MKFTKQDIEKLAYFKGIEAMFYFKEIVGFDERIDACAFEAPNGYHFSPDSGSDKIGIAGLGSQNIATLESSHTVYRKRGRSTVSEFYKDMYQLLVDIKSIQCSADSPCTCWEDNGCVYWVDSKEEK
jgi:hypothetical protein|tara:strand:- start:1481 stop:1861 length:381 start_codon:yes stop_codon:yes gene_type:complete